MSNQKFKTKVALKVLRDEYKGVALNTTLYKVLGVNKDTLRYNFNKAQEKGLVREDNQINGLKVNQVVWYLTPEGRNYIDSNSP